MDQQKMLGVYESVAELSARMLEAARGGKWDQLIELEADCKSLLGTLIASGTPRPLTPEVAARKGQLIRKVLADDAQIRDLAEPRLAELGRFLFVAERGRKVERAYAADRR